MDEEYKRMKRRKIRSNIENVLFNCYVPSSKSFFSSPFYSFLLLSLNFPSVSVKFSSSSNWVFPRRRSSFRLYLYVHGDNIYLEGIFASFFLSPPSPLPLFPRTVYFISVSFLLFFLVFVLFHSFASFFPVLLSLISSLPSFPYFSTFFSHSFLLSLHSFFPPSRSYLLFFHPSLLIFLHFSSSYLPSLAPFSLSLPPYPSTAENLYIYVDGSYTYIHKYIVIHTSTYTVKFCRVLYIN